MPTRKTPLLLLQRLTTDDRYQRSGLLFGFTVQNEFLVEYGLDYDNKFRNLPYISVFKKSG